MSAMSEPLLQVRGLNAWYGDSHVLHGIDFDIGENEVVTLVGRNGAGKTSTVRSIMGLMERRTGSIRFAGKDIIARSPIHISRMGIGYVPEERGIFATLTVEENLMLPPVIRKGGFSLQQIFDLFPNLRERIDSMGTQLSGGEQQMLAIARILRTGARFIILDEPTEGLAPVIVQQIEQCILGLKQQGFTILLVEQSTHFAAQVSDRHVVIEHGHVAETIPNSEVGQDGERLLKYLSV